MTSVVKRPHSMARTKRVPLGIVLAFAGSCSMPHAPEASSRGTNHQIRASRDLSQEETALVVSLLRYHSLDIATRMDVPIVDVNASLVRAENLDERGEGICGRHEIGSNEIQIAIDRDGVFVNDATIRHELAHVYVGRYFGDLAPWIQEGLARMFEGTGRDCPLHIAATLRSHAEVVMQIRADHVRAYSPDERDPQGIQSMCCGLLLAESMEKSMGIVDAAGFAATMARISAVDLTNAEWQASVDRLSRGSMTEMVERNLANGGLRSWGVLELAYLGARHRIELPVDCLLRAMEVAMRDVAPSGNPDALIRNYYWSLYRLALGSNKPNEEVCESMARVQMGSCGARATEAWLTRDRGVAQVRSCCIAGLPALPVADWGDQGMPDGDRRSRLRGTKRRDATRVVGKWLRSCDKEGRDSQLEALGAAVDLAPLHPFCRWPLDSSQVDIPSELVEASLTVLRRLGTLTEQELARVFGYDGTVGLQVETMPWKLNRLQYSVWESVAGNRGGGR